MYRLAGAIPGADSFTVSLIRGRKIDPILGANPVNLLPVAVTTGILVQNSNIGKL